MKLRSRWMAKSRDACPGRITDDGSVRMPEIETAAGLLVDIAGMRRHEVSRQEQRALLAGLFQHLQARLCGLLLVDAAEAAPVRILYLNRMMKNVAGHHRVRIVRLQPDRDMPRRMSRRGLEKQ